jgi:hypothetical protein
MSKFIIESSIFQEAEIIKSTPSKAIYRMVMQTCDEVNQNKRLYPRAVLEEGMANTKERLYRRSLLGELDHPVPTGNETFDGIRQTTVQLKEVCHLIRDYQFEGNKLIGELETVGTEQGRNLFALLKDKITVGLSMRGLAELDHENGVNIVKSPLYIITFDTVTLPSHKSALVDFNEMRFESLNVIHESSCGVICTPNGQCYLPNYFDKLVETKVIKFFEKWV